MAQLIFPSNYKVGKYHLQNSFLVLIYKTLYGFSYSNTHINLYLEEMSIADLQTTIIDELLFLKEAFGLCHDNLLGNSALELKRWINDCVV